MLKKILTRFGNFSEKITIISSRLVGFTKAIINLIEFIKLIKFAVASKWNLESFKRIFNFVQSLTYFSKQTKYIYLLLDKFCLKYLKINYRQILWIYDKYTRLYDIFFRNINIKPLTISNLKNYTDSFMYNTNSFNLFVKRIISYKGIYLNLIFLNIALYILMCFIDVEIANMIFIPLIHIMFGIIFLHIYIYIWEVKIYPLYIQKDYYKLRPYLILGVIVLLLAIIFIIYGIYLYVILIKGKYYAISSDSNSSRSDRSSSEPENPYSSKTPKDPKDPKDPNVYYAENPSSSKEKNNTEKDSETDEREGEARRQRERERARSEALKKKIEELEKEQERLEKEEDDFYWWYNTIDKYDVNTDNHNAYIQQKYGYIQQQKEEKERREAEVQARKTEEMWKKVEDEERKTMEENNFFNWGNTGERKIINQEQLREKVRLKQKEEEQIKEQERIRQYKEAEDMDIIDHAAREKWLREEAQERAEKAAKKAEESARKADARKLRRKQKAAVEKNKKLLEDFKGIDAVFNEYDEFVKNEQKERREAEEEARKAEEEARKAKEEKAKKAEVQFWKDFDAVLDSYDEHVKWETIQEKEKKQRDIINSLKKQEDEEAEKKRKADEDDFFNWGNTGKKRK